ncbi:MAG: sigma 54-interacting transcriptional regulator [Balneolaceae bacterium]
MNSSPSISQTALKKSLLSEVEKSSKSILMQDIFNKILTIAKLDTHVIVIGEIGSGKKRLAQIIHENSSRAKGPFYSFYCVDVNEDEYKEAFREQLHLEEEHFILKYNAIEKACDGILYLDQFSELPPQLMLSIIHSYIKGSEQLYRHNQEIKPRLIISMNHESYHKVLSQPVWKTVLDLIDPVVIMVPPLRERKEDIPVIIDSFLNEIRGRYNDWKNLDISAQALRECFNYNWPGNIRQLKNALLQGAILSYGETIESHHLPFSMSWKLPYEFEGNEFLS